DGFAVRAEHPLRASCAIDTAIALEFAIVCIELHLPELAPLHERTNDVLQARKELFRKPLRLAVETNSQVTRWLRIPNEEPLRDHVVCRRLPHERHDRIQQHVFERCRPGVELDVEPLGTRWKRSQWRGYHRGLA